MKRSSGILMPIFSLPSPHGIGTLGASAYRFADFLKAADQSFWQILPVGPTSIGDSPYQSPSAHAGNPWFIDLDLLMEHGLLEKNEIEAVRWGEDPGRVDYGTLYHNRPLLLRKAMERGYERNKKDVEAFAEENSFWLADYALFMALKKRYDMRSWLEWPDEDVRLRRPDALERCRKELAEDIRYFTFNQFLFFRQWEDFRNYVHEKGILIIGDMALYVALDSADVWASPENFLLDEKNCPKEVAGVPPDAFTADGQLWGNPLYNYPHMEEDGYQWWIKRIRGTAKLYDAVRIDHFRGLASYWSIPVNETTAKNGRWVKGPGMSLISALKEAFPNLHFIAEDLGYPTDDVTALLQESGFPGMNVLEFSFDSRDAGGSLPEDFVPNSICYTGTHDNQTLKGWFESADPKDVQDAIEYFHLDKEKSIIRGMLEGGMNTASDLFISQMTDWLELGDEARINTPGTLTGNWQWRLTPGLLSGELAEEIAEMTALSKRSRTGGF